MKTNRTIWKPALMIASVFLLATLPGCFTTIYYVPHGTPVQIAEDVEDVDVWVKDKETGEKVRSRMTLPAGWFALPLEANDHTKTAKPVADDGKAK